MRRWRSLKRRHIDNVVYQPRHNKIVENLNASVLGLQYREKDIKNAFLHPTDPEAKFPQFKPAPIIDLRSTSIPGSGREWSGANRKTKMIKEKMVTKEYKLTNENDDESEQGEERGQQQIKVPRQERMQVEVENKGYKGRKTRKSKLRKTMVF